MASRIREPLINGFSKRIIAGHRRSTSLSAVLSPQIRTWEDLGGPIDLPIIGTGHVFMGKETSSGLHLMTEKLVNTYGKVFRLSMPILGIKRQVGIACPQLMEEIIRSEDPIPQRDAPLPWRLYLRKRRGEGGLLTTQGREWEKRRQIVRPLMLKPSAMDPMLPRMEQIAEDFCTYLTSKRDGSNYVDQLSQEISRFTFEVMVETMYGERAGCFSSGQNQGDDFLNAVVEILSACFNSLMMFSEFQSKINTALWRKHVRAWDTAMHYNRTFTDTMVGKASKSKSVSDITPLALSLLQSSKLGNSDVEYMLLEFLFGGVDTTANALGFILHLLATHPEKQQKLRTEIEQVLANTQKLDAVALEKMKYLNCCIKEALRLYPALFINGRTLQKDYSSKCTNIELKAGDNIMFFHYCINRDPELWKDADKFTPERFDRALSTPNSSERQAVSVPFGLGTRGCIGKRIAEQEIRVLIIKILTRFELTPDPAFELTPVTRALLTPGKNIPVRFIDRIIRRQE